MLKVMEKGKKVEVRFRLGETAKTFLKRHKDGRFEFKCDVYVKDKYCKGIFYELCQAREVIPEKELGDNVLFWERLRSALRSAGLKPIRIPGGAIPIHYEDEIVVPDFCEEKGSYYFVIKRKDIGKYIAQFPLDPAGKARKEIFDLARSIKEDTDE